MLNYETGLKSETKKVVKMLSEKDYESIARYTKGIRLSMEDIKYFIDDFGCTISMPPDYVFDNLDIVEVTNSSPKEWSIRCPLWTKEEGRSDLSIELSVSHESEGLFRVELDNIMVF